MCSSDLFVLAAEQGLELKADTLLAAAGAAPGVRSLSGRAAGAAAQRLLLSGAPEALGVLCAAGAYASFGLPQRAPCLHGLAEAPAVPMARWWLYLRRCGTSAVRDASLCAALELDAALPEALDYDAAARTLALADPRWNSQPALYAALRLSREPYLPAQLAVTSAELTAAHIRGGRQAWVLRGLLDAVIAAPQINFPEALLALAKTLAGQA